MLHLGPCLALGAIDLFVPLSQWRVAVGALVGEVFGLGRFGLECALLAPVGAVTVQTARTPGRPTRPPGGAARTCERCNACNKAGRPVVLSLSCSLGAQPSNCKWLGEILTKTEIDDTPDHNHAIDPFPLRGQHESSRTPLDDLTIC